MDSTIETEILMKEKSDIEIVNLYKKNADKKLIGELYQRYTSFVFLISMKYMKDEEASQDIVMQVFEKLFEDLKKYEVKNFKSWIYSVAKNQCLLNLRKTKSEDGKQKDFKINSEIIMESDEDFNPIGKDLKEQELQKLEQSIKKLKEKQQTCIELFFLQEKSYKEVVEITGFDMKKVKSYIQNGKRKLKMMMEE